MEVLQTQRETFSGSLKLCDCRQQMQQRFLGDGFGCNEQGHLLGGETKWKTFLICGCTRARLMLSEHFMTAICAMILQTKLCASTRVASLMYLFSCVAQRQPRLLSNLIFIICKHFSSNVSSKQSVKLKSESFPELLERDQGSGAEEHP